MPPPPPGSAPPMPPMGGMPPPPPPPPEPPRPITEGPNYQKSLLSMVAPGAPGAPPPPPPPPGGAPVQKPQDDIYSESSIFKTNNWRERKTSRIGGLDEGAGTFAQGLVSDDPLTRPSRLNKESVVTGGLFDGGALKDGADEKKTQALGLFDDSDDEREAKKELQQSQMEVQEPVKKYAQKPKGMFDIDEEEEDDGFFAKKVQEQKKTIVPDFLGGGDSDDEDEFKPKLLSKKAGLPALGNNKPKKTLFGDDSDEDLGFVKVDEKPKQLPKI